MVVMAQDAIALYHQARLEEVERVIDNALVSAAQNGRCGCEFMLTDLCPTFGDGRIGLNVSDSELAAIKTRYQTEGCWKVEVLEPLSDREPRRVWFFAF